MYFSLHHHNEYMERQPNSQKVLQTELNYLAPLFFPFLKRDLDSPSYIVRVRTHRPQCLLIWSLKPIKALAWPHFHIVILVQDGLPPILLGPHPHRLFLHGLLHRHLHQHQYGDRGHCIGAIIIIFIGADVESAHWASISLIFIIMRILVKW